MTDEQQAFCIRTAGANYVPILDAQGQFNGNCEISAVNGTRSSPSPSPITHMLLEKSVSEPSTPTQRLARRFAAFLQTRCRATPANRAAALRLRIINGTVYLPMHLFHLSALITNHLKQTPKPQPASLPRPHHPLSPALALQASISPATASAGKSSVAATCARPSPYGRPQPT